jgi:hypothetical protein
VTARFAYFQCPNCKENIHIPFATPRELPACLPRLPKETWSIWFLCLECDTLSTVRARDVHLNLPQKGVHSRRRENTQFYRIDTKCAYKGCGILRPVFVHSSQYLTENTAVQKLRDSFPRPYCYMRPAPHALASDFELIRVTEVFSLW